MMNFNLLTKYKTSIMGVALLLVVFFHLPFNIPSVVLNNIKSFGFMGVDIFLLLSGITLYLSFLKDSAIDSFMRKRLLRILPSYLIVCVLFYFFLSFLTSLDFKQVVLNVFMLGYWLRLPHFFDWYIPSLMVFYFLTPIYLSMVKDDRSFIVSLIVILISSSVIVYCIEMQDAHMVNLFYSRIPIFFTSLFIGKLIHDKKTIPSSVYILLFLIGLPSMLLGFYFRARGIEVLYKFLYIGIYLGTIPLCLSMGFVFEKLQSRIKFRFLNFLGTYSLPIYLIHERLMLLFYHGLLEKPLSNYQLMGLHLSILLVTFVLAYFLQRFTNYIVERYFNKKKVQGETSL